jgi:hypothetical protein
MGVDIQSMLGGTIASAFKEVMSVFKVDPTTALEKSTELKKIEADTNGKIQDALTAEVESAASIIRAEAQSQSWLPRNVRPLLLLLWGIAITMNAFVPIIARFWVPNFQPFTLDPWVYKLTAIGFTGYVAFRSAEKISGKD